METALENLRIAEDEVFEIMEVAKNSLEELQNLPQCNSDKLIELSAKYMQLIQSVYQRITIHSSTMTISSDDNSGEIYTTKKENDIYESLRCQSATPADDSNNMQTS